MNTVKELTKRLKIYGEDSLTSQELLAIIIGETKEEKSQIEIAKQIINKNKNITNNLKFLYDITIQELIEYEGIDEFSAARIKAAMGICKKLAKPITIKETPIKSAKDIADLFMEELRYERKEIIKIVILNAKNIVEKIITLSIGNANSATIIARDILAEPIKMNAPKFVLVHNHPSGDSKPSKKDLEATKMIFNCAAAMGIELLDHIVIGNGTFESAL